MGDSDGHTNNNQVYVFERSEEGWSEATVLTASDDHSYTYFGRTVALEGSVIVAVVPGMTGYSPGRAYGAAYVFEPSGEEWAQTARLTPIVEKAEMFGSALAIKGDTVVVGASNLTLGGENPGAIYVFERSAGEFYRATKLVTGEDGQDGLGAQVALAGDYLVSGAISGGEKHLFLYKRYEDSWALVNRLAESDLHALSLGASIALTEEQGIIYGVVDGVASLLHLPR